MPSQRRGAGSSKRNRSTQRPGQGQRQGTSGRAASARQAAREAAEREAAEREAARQRRIRRNAIVAAAAALVVALAVIGFFVFRGDDKKPTAAPGPTGTVATSPTAAATGSAGPTAVPNWPSPAAADVPGLVRAAGLTLLRSEGTAVHFHTHLDILVDGKPVTVPGDVGIAGNSGISSLHSHETDGVIHVEAPAPGRWTLGQFFTQWRVKLTQSCIGELCATADKPLRFYLNGQPYQADPNQIELTSHGEIAIVYGQLPAGQQPPASYDFPPGQ
jgi:hypothetical protein